jgi:hypothetical protein
MRFADRPIRPADLAELLARNARAAGITLDDIAWAAMDEDQRYALIKLGNAEQPSHNFAAALEEFLSPRPLRAEVNLLGANSALNLTWCKRFSKRQFSPVDTL